MATMCLRRSPKRDEEEHNLVVSRAHEADSDKQTLANDKGFSLRISQSCEEAEAEFEEIYRHGIKLDVKPLVLKLKFRRENIAKKLLYKMKQRKLFGAMFTPRSRIRCDLNSAEQAREREALERPSEETKKIRCYEGGESTTNSSSQNYHHLDRRERIERKAHHATDNFSSVSALLLGFFLMCDLGQLKNLPG
ncbi:unnamed protein product [Toxocara canis]|uniref:N-acetyltransferase domain-containing protein n=1 Tax=Toxocara canis TaxID=6265 RepID=A0A183TVH8_TOXCA|nr:unnamed protein product [Toxocara canis]